MTTRLRRSVKRSGSHDEGPPDSLSLPEVKNRIHDDKNHIPATQGNSRQDPTTVEQFYKQPHDHLELQKLLAEQVLRF